MASASLSALRLQPPSKFSSSLTRHFPQSSIHINAFPNYKTHKFNFSKVALCALAQSSDSPKSLDEDPQILLQELADCFALPADYFLRLDVSFCVKRNVQLKLIQNKWVKDSTFIMHMWSAIVKTWRRVGRDIIKPKSSMGKCRHLNICKFNEQAPIISKFLIDSRMFPILIMMFGLVTEQEAAFQVSSISS